MGIGEGGLGGPPSPIPIRANSMRVDCKLRTRAEFPGRPIRLRIGTVVRRLGIVAAADTPADW